MPINDYIAQGMQPFNAASTLAMAEDIRGARGQNALLQMKLQQEQDPGSLINRARELELRSGAAQARQLEQQNDIPKYRAAVSAMNAVMETIEKRGASAGRQKLSEQISFFKSEGLFPKDFEIDADIDSMSDEEFAREIEMAQQQFSIALNSTDEGARTSAAIGDMQRLGYPMTPEGLRQYTQDHGNGDMDLLRKLELEVRTRGLMLEQERDLLASRREAEEMESARVAERQSIVRNLEQNRSAVDLTQRLEGTFLESGLPMSDARRSLASLTASIAGLVGRDTSGVRQVISDFDSQRKLLQDQVNSRIASGDYGRSATQLSSIERSLASPEISPQAIIHIQGQLGQIDIDRAEAKNIDVPGMDEYRQLVDQWKNYAPSGAVGGEDDSIITLPSGAKLEWIR